MNPPPLPWPVRTAPERWILMVSAAGALLFAGVAALSAFGHNGWICAWREFTGLPCAGCGGTRSLLLILSGHWLEAFRLNPGAVLAVGLLVLANLYALGVLVLRRDPGRPRGPGWRWWVGGGLAVNRL